MIRVERRRRVNGAESVEVAYFVTSLGRDRADAARLLALVRAHWHVENPQSEDWRSDNLCDVGRAGYHLG